MQLKQKLACPITVCMFLVIILSRRTFSLHTGDKEPCEWHLDVVKFELSESGYLRRELISRGKEQNSNLFLRIKILCDGSVSEQSISLTIINPVSV